MGFGFVSRNMRLVNSIPLLIPVPEDLASGVDAVLVASTSMLILDSGVGADSLIVNTAKIVSLSDAGTGNDAGLNVNTGQVNLTDTLHGTEQVNVGVSGNFNISVSDAGIGTDSQSIQILGGGVVAPLVTISWTPVAGATGYFVYWGNVRSGNHPNKVDAGNSTVFQLGSLTQGTTYYFQVSAYDAGGIESFQSMEISTAMPFLNQRFYVDAVNGSDSNPGSVNSPFRSVAKCHTVMNPGDTFLFKAGTYAVAQQNWTRSGSAGHKITFRPFDENGSPDAVLWDSAASGTGAACHSFSTSSYLRFQQLEMANFHGAPGGIKILCQGSHLEFVNNDIHGYTNGGNNDAMFMIHGGNTSQGQTTQNSLMILGNKIHNSTGGTAAFCVWSAMGGFIRMAYNEFYDANPNSNQMDGFQIGGGDTGTGASNHLVMFRNYHHQLGTGDTQQDIGGHAISNHYLVEQSIIGSVSGASEGKKWKFHNGDRLSPNNFYTDGVSNFSIFRFVIINSCWNDSYDQPNAAAHYNNTHYGNESIFVPFVNGGSAPLNVFDTVRANLNGWGESFGETIYAGGDHGRMIWKNLLYYAAGPSGQIIIDYHAGNSPSFLDHRYSSMRFFHNCYISPSSSQFVWGTGAGTWATYTAGSFATYQASLAGNNPDVGSVWFNSATFTPLTQFRAPATTGLWDDYRITSGSKAKGHPNVSPTTFATNAGVNQTTIALDRASFFCDGYKNSLGELMHEPDTIYIGNQLPVQIVTVNDAASTVVIASPRTWNANDPVTLQDPRTLKPVTDFGAMPFVSDTQLSMPTGLKVMQTKVV